MRHPLYLLISVLLFTWGCKKEEQQPLPEEIQYNLIYGIFRTVGVYDYSKDFFRVSDLDTNETQICTYCEDFDLSHDGKKILCSRYGGGYGDKVFLFSTDCDTQYFQIHGRYAKFSPNEQEIVYQKTSRPESNSIYKADVSTVTETYLADGFKPSWNFDASKIVFSRWSDSIPNRFDGWIMDNNGGNQQKIFTDALNGLSHILFPSNTENKIVYDSEGSVYMLNPNGGNTIILQDSVSFRDFKWSPDGNEIAFLRKSVLYKMKKDGSNLTMLVPKTIQSFSWSKDGSKISYSTAEGLFVLDLESMQSVQVNNQLDIYFVDWLPE